MKTITVSGVQARQKSQTVAWWLVFFFGPFGLLYVKPTRMLLFLVLALFITPIGAWILSLCYARAYVREFNTNAIRAAKQEAVLNQQLAAGAHP